MPVRDILYHPVSGKTNNLILFFFAIVPAFVLFSFPISVFSNGIDPPLAWVFNFLAEGKFTLGKNIIFPHGPLAFLMYPLPTGSNFWIAVSIHLAARIFLAYCLLKLATRKPLGCMALALVSSFLLLAINDLLLTIVQIIILCYLNFFERRNVWWLIPALIITPLALFIKAFAGIACLVVTLPFFGIMTYRAIIGFESWYRLILLLIVPFIILAAWLGLYGNLIGISGYMKGMADLAADNSAAVAVYPVNNWWITGSALVSGLILIVFNAKNGTLVRYAILAGPVFFAIWKYGMAREDYLHTSMLFVFVLFIVLVYIILSSKFQWVNAGLSILIVVLFYLTLQKSYYFEPFRIRTDGIQKLVSRVIHYSYFADTCDQASLKAIERNKLDKRILDIIGNKTADIYPWDYSYIAANRLNWQPRPVLQSYASYTSELDGLNASHFQSDKAPEFLIWELRKITRDIHGGSLESIDGRYLLNDEPQALTSILSRYELVEKQEGIFPILVLRKRAEEVQVKTVVVGQTKGSWNTWIEVPENKQHILKASVRLDRSVLGRLKSFFYKDEAAYVYYLLENGDIRMYRIVPENAAYGLWINPLIMNPEAGETSPAVKMIMFRCSNTSLMKNEIDIKWNQVSFRSAAAAGSPIQQIKNPVYAFFGITGDTRLIEILSSSNNLEKNTVLWSVPDESKILSTGRNRSLQLLPGDYSLSFEYALDSLSSAKKDGKLIVRTGLWAHAPTGAKAVYVISIEKGGESMLWKGVDIQDFIHDSQKLNYVTNYAVLDNDLLAQQGLILKVYAWNTGKQKITLDDFSVRIEMR